MMCITGRHRCIMLPHRPTCGMSRRWEVYITLCYVGKRCEYHVCVLPRRFERRTSRFNLSFSMKDMYITFVFRHVDTRVIWEVFIMFSFRHVGMSSVHHINETEEDMGQRNLSMRSPMQWDNTSHAGFCKCTKGQPWMPLNPQYRRVNVEVNVYSNADRVNLFNEDQCWNKCGHQRLC